MAAATPRSWLERNEELACLARKQLFFIGGAPRSGTTWLQQILDAHPDISCHGEGLFQTQLANPLEALMLERRRMIEDKNTKLFAHTGGFPLPEPADTEALTGTAILLALLQQTAGQEFAAIGEKTPENVFFFPRLRRIFPAAKFITIARDPRDVLTSAWHFFHKPVAGEDEARAKLAFIKSALPSLAEGGRATLAFARAHPADSMVLTYETLSRDPVPLITRLYRFLGVDDAPHLVARSIETTAFASQTGGRAAGNEMRGSFLRKGTPGDWVANLTPEMNDLLLRELGWMFPDFGWRP